jgi:hypothetical protein
VLTKLLPQMTKDFLCNRFMYWKAKVIGVARCRTFYLLGMFYVA